MNWLRYYYLFFRPVQIPSGPATSTGGYVPYS